MTVYYSPSAKGFFDTELNYHALPDDVIEITPLEHEQLLNALNMEGKEIYIEEGAIKTRPVVYVPTWDEIRAKRNGLLSETDYTQMPDWPGDKTAWATYRQTLRDIPQTYSAPEDVIWPTAPGD